MALALDNYCRLVHMVLRIDARSVALLQTSSCLPEMNGLSQGWKVHASFGCSPTMWSRTFDRMRSAKRIRIDSSPTNFNVSPSSRRSLHTSLPARWPRQALGKIEPLRIRVELPEGFSQRSVWKPILVRVESLTYLDL